MQSVTENWQLHYTVGATSSYMIRRIHHIVTCCPTCFKVKRTPGGRNIRSRPLRRASQYRGFGT